MLVVGYKKKELILARVCVITERNQNKKEINRFMDEDGDITLVETPEPYHSNSNIQNRRVERLLHDERIYSQKTKRKRCDTWHGDEQQKTTETLDPDIEQGLNTKRKFAR